MSIGLTPPRPEPATSRRRRALVVAALVALLVAPPLLAYHGDIADLFGDDSEPAETTQTVPTWQPATSLDPSLGVGAFASHGPRLRLDRVRQVAELRAGGGTLSLWDAPQLTAGRCWAFVFKAEQGEAEPLVSGSCDPSPPGPGPVGRPQWLELYALPGALVVHARVQDGASVVLRLADGTSRKLDPIAGHAVAAVPADPEPVALVAASADGTVVRTVRLDAPPPVPCPALCTGDDDRGFGNATAG